MEQKEYEPATGEEVTVKRKRNKRDGYFDYSLLFVWIFIMLLGYVLLYSASSYTALNKYNDSAYFLKKQIQATAFGVAVMIPVILLDYRLLKKYKTFIYCFSLFTVLLILTPLGKEANGAKRWINLKLVQFQPAEIVKIGVIIMTAAILSKCGQQAIKKGKLCWQIYSITLLGAGLVYVLTSNLSSAIIIAGIGAVMIIVAGAGKWFTGTISVGLVGGIIGLYILRNMPQLASLSFRFERIAVWKNHENFLQGRGKGFQPLQGLYAIGSGGIFGKGLGNSAQKLGFVPEANNDMIFSIICEELGIFGAICIILLFVFMIRRMRVIASNAPDMFGSMIVVGVLAHISIQVVLNIAVVTTLIPNTGVSLPFISYGGTSLMFLIIEMGMVLSVSRRIKRIR